MQENKRITSYRLGLKSKILHTAMTMFAQKGIKSVRMDDIARSMNISKRTLYEVYSNKEELLYEGVVTYVNLRDSEFKEYCESTTNVMDIIINVYRMKVNDFQNTNPLFYDEIGKYPRVLAYFEDNRKKNNLLLSDFLARGTREGYFRSDMNYELTILLFNSVGDLFISQRLYARYSVETVFRNIMFISLRGICTAKGIKALDDFLQK